MKSEGRWSSVRLEQLCSRITSGGTPARKHEARFYAPDGYPWVKTQELKDNVILDTEEHITDVGVAESSAKVLPVGTSLLAMYGATVGQVGMLGVPAACNQACAALIPDPSRTDARFLFFALVAHRAHWRNLAVGSAQQNISGQLVKTTVINAPPLAEQRRIAWVLRSLDENRASQLEVANTCRDLAATIFRKEFVL